MKNKSLFVGLKVGFVFFLLLFIALDSLFRESHETSHNHAKLALAISLPLSFMLFLIVWKIDRNYFDSKNDLSQNIPPLTHFELKKKDEECEGK